MAKKDLPAIASDALIEVTAEQIEKGMMLSELNEAIGEAHRALDRRRKAGHEKGKVTVKLVIDITPIPKIDDAVDIAYQVDVKAPKDKRSCTAKSVNGLLLCQADGASSESPDQLKLFNRSGKAIGLVDTATGEFLPPEEKSSVAGSIKAATG